MNYRYVILLIFGLSLLSACKPSCDDLPICIDAPAPLKINSFTLMGTSEAVNQVVPINPAINRGVFTMRWEVSLNKYTTYIFVSEDSLEPSQSDIIFYFDTCDSGSDKLCQMIGSPSCRFSETHLLSCKDNYSTDLTSFLDKLPKDAYVTLQVCANFNCDTAKVKVQFQ